MQEVQLAAPKSCKLHRNFHASEIGNAGVGGVGWGEGIRYQGVGVPVLDPNLELEFELEFEFPDPADRLEGATRSLERSPGR